MHSTVRLSGDYLPIAAPDGTDKPLYLLSRFSERKIHLRHIAPLQIYSIKLAWQFVQEAVSSVTKMHCEFKAQICATVSVYAPDGATLADII